MAGKFGCNSRIINYFIYCWYFLLIYCNFSNWLFVLVPVCVLVYMYVYQCKVTFFPVSVCNLIVNIWGPQTMRAYISLSFIFLEIKKKEYFWIYSLKSITSTKNNHKPAKGGLSSSQLFVTSPHLIWRFLNFLMVLVYCCVI